MLIKLLMVGDVHLSDRPPSTRTQSYRDDILAKLDEIATISKLSNVDAVVFVGDIFHSKKPGRTSHELVRRTMEAFRKMPLALVVPGNHDYDKANPDNIDVSPLGVVAQLPNVHLIGTDEMRSYNLKGCKIAGFREEQALGEFPTGADIVVAHAAIFPPGETPGVWEAWDAEAVAQVYDGYFETMAPRLIYYGHIHDPHGVYKVEGITFANLGAISRGSMFEKEFDRTPEVGMVTFDPGGVKVNPVPLRSARPAEEVFRIEEVTQERTEASEKSEFIEALREAEVEVFSVERSISAISERSDVEVVVRNRAIELIQEVS